MYLTTEGVCSYAVTGPTDEVKEFFTIENVLLESNYKNAAKIKLLKLLDRIILQYSSTE